MDLLQSLRNAIEIEQRYSDDNYQEKMKKTLEERIAKGYTLHDFSITKIDFIDGCPTPYCRLLDYPDAYIYRVHIHCNRENVSRLREGSSVVLSNGIYRFEMSIVKDGVQDMILESSEFSIKDNYINCTSYPREGWEINEQHLNINQKLMMSTWAFIQNNPVINSKMSNLLDGRTGNIYINSLVNTIGNKSQDEALSKSIFCSDFHIVQGPPGTGKTYTIANIVKRLIGQGMNVFVTAPTHTAINNCLNSISKFVKDPSKVVKIGEKYQAEEILRNKNITRKTKLPYLSYSNSNSELSKSGIVIGATPYALCYPISKKLNDWTFDYIIIDEAAQMSMPLALSAMVHGKKFIFVGDHKQLDPIIPSEQDNVLLSNSIFKHMVDLYPLDCTLLDLSYRLSTSLIRIPSQIFYNGRIHSVKQDNKDYTNFRCCEYGDIIKESSNEILYVHKEFDGIGRSPFEANVVASIVKTLVDNGVSKDEIGLITPYRAQVREIKKALVNKSVISDDSINDIFVDTIDRMQGQEKDYIVFSIANTNPEEVEDRLDFFYSANRLNVAITRAKIKNIVLANEKVFGICKERVTSLMSSPLKTGMQSYIDFYNESTKIYQEKTNEDWW